LSRQTLVAEFGQFRSLDTNCPANEIKFQLSDNVFNWV